MHVPRYCNKSCTHNRGTNILHMCIYNIPKYMHNGILLSYNIKLNIADSYSLVRTGEIYAKLIRKKMRKIR